MKNTLIHYIDDISDQIIEMGMNLYKNPELGFKEFKTADYIINFLEHLSKKSGDIRIERNISRTGIKSQIGSGGVNICIIADMDAIPTLGHPLASDDNNAAHACGHSNQLAIMLGVFKTIYDLDIMKKYGGRLTFIATPAEEYTDLYFRKELRKKGEITYLSGKQDMIAKGIFDDVDVIINCHSMGGASTKVANVNSSLTGFLSKSVKYYGVASHAGAEPHRGVNALNAAMIGLNAVHVQRETFLDENNVRVHGIITNGGQTVNSVPELVELEFMIRGNDVEAIIDANDKVNRALKAGAYAVGARCEIHDASGYLPFHQNKMISAILKNNMSTLIPLENIEDGGRCMASGDVGDLGAIKPTVQLGFGGFAGNIHGSDFRIADNEMAYIIPTKAIAMSIYDLLMNDAQLTKHVTDKFTPIYTKDEYISKWLGKFCR